jgi:hypothetical protein
MNTRKCEDPIEYLVVHHAVIPQTYTDETCLRILRAEARQKYGDAFGGLYNYTILPSGKCAQLVPPGYYAPHCGFNHGEGSAITNDNSIGISVCARMDIEKILKPVIFNSLVNEILWLMKQYSIPVEKVKKHSDVVATNCPGTYFPWAKLINEVNGKMKTYPDVDQSRWSFQGIKYAVDAGLMKGDSDGHFYPEKPLTREEFCVVLKRLKDKGVI